MKKFACFLFITILSLCVKGQSNRVLFKADLTKSLSQFPSLEILNDKALLVTDSVMRFGQKSIRSEISSGNDDIKGIRSEIAFKPETEAEGWYGLSIFAPKSYLPDPEPEAVTQWHNVPDKGEGWLSPSLSLWVENGRWTFHLLWDTAKITKQDKFEGKISTDLGPVKLNSWNDWVFHIKFSFKSDGLVEIFHNGQKVLSNTGPNDFNDDVLPYWKIGLYKWVYKNHNSKSHKFNKRVLYYSQIKKGGKNSCYNDVAPSP